MAGRNAELMRAAIEAFNSGDVESFLGHVAAEAEWLPMKGKVEGVTYHGHDGVRRFMRELREEFADVRYVDAAVSERGADQVIVCGRYHARGRASGAAIEMPLCQVVDFVDGKIVRMEAYEELAAALGASDSTSAT